MTQPYRDVEYRISCTPQLDEDVLLVRTTQRYRGVSKAQMSQGKIVFVSMYGIKSAPFTDNLVTSLYRMHRWDASA